MADVIRNAVIRLAIESGQSQLVLPNVQGFIAAEKEAQAATQATTAAMEAQSVSAVQLTGTTNALAAGQQGLYRGIGNSLRGLALLGVATGELDAKSLQAIVAVEGLAGAMRGAAAIATFFGVAVEPAVVVMAGLVAALYAADRAWTAEARAMKEAEDQTKKNMDAAKQAMDLQIELAQAVGHVQEEEARKRIRLTDEVMAAVNKAYEEEKKQRDAGASLFEMSPLEQNRVMRARAELQQRGITNMTDYSLKQLAQHDPESRGAARAEEDIRWRRTHGNLPGAGESPLDEKATRDNERYMTAKHGFEETNREAQAQITATINLIKISFRQLEEAFSQIKAAKIHADAATSAAQSSPGIYTPTFIHY